MRISAVPIGSPNCHWMRFAYARGSKSAGRWKSCSAFEA
jgi:hypothetical protein